MNAIKSLPLSESQAVAIRSLPNHGEAQLPSTRSTVSAEVYLDQNRFDAEWNRIFRGRPVPLTVSALLPEPGMHLVNDSYGVPVLLTRDRQGEIHAFLNVCKHRGSILCEEREPKSALKLTCPYHAWTFDLHGSLVAVPRQETFPGLDKASLSLSRLPCREVGGIVWVGLDHRHEPSFDDVTGSIAADIDAFRLAQMRVYRSKSYTVSANWKLIMDAFLESYHVLRLHAGSVARFFVDAPSAVDRIGPHVRLTQGRANFDRANAVPDFSTIRHTVSFAYNLFPSAVLITSPKYISVMVMMPRSRNETQIEYHMLVDPGPPSDTSEDLYERSFTLMDRVFGEEDFRAACLVQRGLATRAVSDTLLGGLEYPVRLFHDSVETALGNV